MILVERESHLGRKPKYNEKAKDKVVMLWNKGLTQAEIATKIGCGKSTVYRILKERR